MGHLLEPRSSTTYKRILNEYANYANRVSVNYQFNYKIICTNLFKSDISFILNKKTYKICIFYNHNYPFVPPLNIKINNIDIDIYYNNIMKNNNDIFDKCLCCESLLCINNWAVNKDIENIMEEIIKIINYSYLSIYKILLKKIFNKYTNESVDYLNNYLIM
tara:strand:+ start:63 stop:548 length:486 start_codon:yes stop_codon:yes gene_type:complete